MLIHHQAPPIRLIFQPRSLTRLLIHQLHKPPFPIPLAPRFTRRFLPARSRALDFSQRTLERRGKFRHVVAEECGHDG